MSATRAFLRQVGLPDDDARELPSSALRFADGAQYRIEIPSVEDPGCLEAVVESARTYGITVHRVSQGSGSFLLTSEELHEMARLGATAGLEVSLFARPSAAWSTSASARSALGAVMAGVAWGQQQVLHVLEDARRAAEHGFRSVLISDIGVLDVFNLMRRDGHLPHDMQAKVSVMLPVANAATARVIEGLGANSINVPADLSLAQIAAIRATVSIPLDVYVESPDSLGGFVRHYEVADIVRVAAPVYLKFGLRNSPEVYPSGTHLRDLVTRLSKERVRRALLGLELLRAHMPDALGSGPRPPDLALPVIQSHPVLRETEAPVAELSL